MAVDNFKRRLEVTIEIGDHRKEFHVFYDPEEGQWEKVRKAYEDSTFFKEKKASVMIQLLKVYTGASYSIEKTINISYA